ncbi:hypothetical protein G6O69_22095 [Pseudenhygromyxa sp. WMMC2535]|uniref:hypothetical protein n=1 Tax=Pseudenhygromyxa sp. WMMC2535 TaxID=2712867 RepID=UPI001554E009|nr:hypothetical protein [Pseudenhygromyxa sp. WMMC2535]NVB40549.1 hypothetical protein [Pseudenhygromyxa sp. WMMC2535]
MAGTLHQGLLRLVRDDPWLPFDLLGLPHPVEGWPLDRRAEVEYEPGDDRPPRQGFPDLVLVVEDPRDPASGVVITVEAQGHQDRVKRWRIPFYQAALANDHALPTWVVVISLCPRMSADIRAWRRGPPPQVDALLLDRESVPLPAALDGSLRRPAAIVLSAVLHATASDISAIEDALAALAPLPREDRARYISILMAAAPKALRAELELQETSMDDHNGLLRIERASGTYHLGFEEGREEGLSRGRRGAFIDMIVEILDARGVALGPHERERLDSCPSETTLQRWARRALVAERATELFEPSA